MLQFELEWRFASSDPIPTTVVHRFSELISRIAFDGQRQSLLEHFKGYFARAAGVPHYLSSNASWAATDLEMIMGQAASNAPLFIEAFYDACEKLRQTEPATVVPSVAIMNRILAECEAGYQIDPPNLIRTRYNEPIAVPESATSLDARAKQLIQASLQASEKLLLAGEGRQAVQEILWLLETVTTAFRGLDTDRGSIQGAYFNKIIGDLRSKSRGRSLDQILGWVMTLHGYLSSPTGGGIRHGLDLKEGVAVQSSEAQLYCNLIRSYITYLMMEHERISRADDKADCLGSDPNSHS